MVLQLENPLSSSVSIMFHGGPRLFKFGPFLDDTKSYKITVPHADCTFQISQHTGSDGSGGCKNIRELDTSEIPVLYCILSNSFAC